MNNETVDMNLEDLVGTKDLKDTEKFLNDWNVKLLVILPRGTEQELMDHAGTSWD